MAEFEIETTDEVVDDVETSYEDNEEETNYDNGTELTVEDYQKEKARREKAEKALVDLKKQLKSKPESKETLSEQDLDMRDEIRDFVKENPEFKDYKDDIVKHRKNWYTLKQAVAIVENDDKTIENRKKTNSMNITASEESWKTTYTKADLENMSQSEYNKIMSLKESGKITIKK